MAERPVHSTRSSEVELVIRCARADTPDLRTSLDEKLDWPTVIATARGHGVLAVIGRRLEEVGWPNVPQSVVDDMTRYRAALAARNTFLTIRLLEVLAALNAAGISAIPYKGPVLGVSAYGDLRLRPFKDLDILVTPRDAAAAKRCLEVEGYRSLTPNTDDRRPARRHSEYSFPVVHQRDSLRVELHWRFAPLFGLGFDDVVSGCQGVGLLDGEVTSLSPEHSLVVQCVHGAKHAWSRFEWLCALAHTINGSPALDWDNVNRYGESAGARRALDLGLVLAGRVGGASVPADVVVGTAARRVLPVAKDISARMFDPAPARPDQHLTLPDFRLRLRSRSVGDRLRYCLYLTHPSEKDVAFVRLPRRLSVLYYAVRPFRIALEHAPGETSRRQAGRALARQLAHQELKSRALQGREMDVVTAMTERWQAVAALLGRTRPVVDNARVLEVGSGAHGLVFGCGRAGAVGLDPLAADYARLFPAWQRGVPTVSGAGEQLPFREHVFDVVLCDNVVDHAEKPREITRELSRVLVPGGLLYFSVNVHHGLYVAAAWLHRTLNTIGVPLAVGPFADHTVHFSPAAAERLFQGLPLSVVWHAVRIDEAKANARSRPPRHPGDLLARAFFKNARLELVARREG